MELLWLGKQKIERQVLQRMRCGTQDGSCHGNDTVWMLANLPAVVI